VRIKRVSFLLPFGASTYTIVSLAPHFYGEICKTSQGVELFQKKKHFREFIELIQNPNTSWIERRAALWSVGQIGSSDTGFKLLQETGIVEYISEQAMQCSTLSMRGTCFYILGLLSMTSAGREVLDKLGWDFPLNTDLAIAVPKDIVSFLKVPKTSFVGPWALDPKNKFGVQTVPSTTGKSSTKLTPENATSVILGHISNLGNNVTQKASHSALQKLRQRYAPFFQSASLMCDAAKMLSSYSFHLPARRFIWFDLFDGVDLSESGISAFDQKN
jgi:rapamycin-insensitive companion of mTOR